MKDGKLHPVTYETDELFTFHHINTYEENGFLVVDLCGYNDGSVWHDFKIIFKNYMKLLLTMILLLIHYSSFSKLQ